MPRLEINLDRLLDLAPKGVQRDSSFMALGLKAASDETLSSVALGGMMSWRFMPDPLSPEQAAEVRKHFRKWVIGNALGERDTRANI